MVFPAIFSMVIRHLFSIYDGFNNVWQKFVVFSGLFALLLANKMFSRVGLCSASHGTS